MMTNFEITLRKTRVFPERTDGPATACQKVMFDRLFGPHATNLQRALGRTTERQGVLSENLANVNTPGYKRRDVDFGIALDEANSQHSPRRFDRALKRTEGIQEMQGPVRVDGNSVNLEQEVAAMADNEIRYQMLTDMTRRYFSGMRDVIQGGR